MLKVLLPSKSKQSKIKQDETEHCRLYLLTNFSVVLQYTKYYRLAGCWFLSKQHTDELPCLRIFYPCANILKVTVERKVSSI